MGVQSMSPWLASALLIECLVCCYGQFFPDKVGFCLSHRYWAGNWVQTFFLVRCCDAVRAKLERVKTFNGHPILPEGAVPEDTRHFFRLLMCSFCAYLWLGNMNMKCFTRLMQQALDFAGGASIDEYEFMALTTYCCGEFRDNLYTDPVLPAIQEEVGFEEGECLMVRLGAFGLGRESATWRLHDMKRGTLAEGEMTRTGVASMHALPSASLDPSLLLSSCRGGSGRGSEPLLHA
mmetsp:Transcript_131815/g.421752  ORF Transcript_131815/g.421752 Transcript_131815/m.421752 type:complete len:235 (-) Transcript_131815:126-830(-)